MYNEIAELGRETLTQDEYLNEVPGYEWTEVFCKRTSIGQQEFYSSAVVSLKPEFKLILADCYDYDNQKIVRYDGKLYDVIRTFIVNNTIELTVKERFEKNA